MRLVDDRGTEIPTQKEVTGLWAKEGPIKWVRFDAIVSSDRRCFVETGSPPTAIDATRPATLADTPRVKVSKQAASVVLDTGVARYVLGRGLSPIAEIYLGQRRVATSAGTRGLYVVDQQGRVASAAADGETMEIEASGPITASVRFEGNYRTRTGEDLARHITRVEVFAGQPSAQNHPHAHHHPGHVQGVVQGGRLGAGRRGGRRGRGPVRYSPRFLGEGPSRAVGRSP